MRAFLRTVSLAFVTFSISAWAADAGAATNKVFRCTGANGKVTLSDRRCPEDEANKPASQASAAADSKACLDVRERLAERRKQKPTSPADRQAVKQLEDEQRRHCGA